MVSVLFIGSTTAQAQPLSASDEDAVRASIRSYQEAWLKGDPSAIMGTLAEHAVLLPSGLAPIVGGRAIRAFWWPPDSPPTKVIAMDLQVDDVVGQGGMAYAWGRGSLTFSYVQDGKEKLVSVQSTFLNVLLKEADGRWRTTCRMWSDKPR